METISAVATPEECQAFNTIKEGDFGLLPFLMRILNFFYSVYYFGEGVLNIMAHNCYIEHLLRFIEADVILYVNGSWVITSNRKTQYFSRYDGRSFFETIKRGQAEIESIKHTFSEASTLDDCTKTLCRCQVEDRMLALSIDTAAYHCMHGWTIGGSKMKKSFSASTLIDAIEKAEEFYGKSS